MNNWWKNNRLWLICYVMVFLVSIYTLLTSNKHDIHMAINGWNSPSLTVFSNFSPSLAFLNSKYNRNHLFHSVPDTNDHPGIIAVCRYIHPTG